MSTVVVNHDLHTSPVTTEAQPRGTVQAKRSSYSQILESTAWVGGSSVLNILIRIVRTKAMALLLGPTGIGLAGLYISVANLAQSIAGMGVNTSGVRQIAEAVGSGDTQRIALTATVLRRVSLGLGLLGAALLVLFTVPISRATFGTDEYTTEVCVLSGAVLFNLVSAGQGALIQGMRLIADLAKMSVLGALFGTLVTIPIVYFFRQDGVVPSLVATAALTLLTSWWYSRRVEIERPSLSSSQVRQEVAVLLNLGLAFMVSALLMMGSAYVIRIIVLHKVSLAATGLYQAAWTIGGLYVGVILQAMGADFYPRLTAVVNDHPECNRLVNEQARVSMLLAGPGVIATLTFAPMVIFLFYAANFGDAVQLLRWLCLGIAMQVISWPMGFIIMAKGKRGAIIFCELAWTVVHLGLALVLVEQFGVTGAGIAFCCSYVFHIALTYAVVRTLSGFRWSAENRQTAIVYTGVIATVFCAFQFLPILYASLLGTLATLITGVYSTRIILLLTNDIRLPPSLRTLTLRLGRCADELWFWSRIRS